MPDNTNPTNQDLQNAKFEALRRYLFDDNGAFAASPSMSDAVSVPGPDPAGNVVGVGIGEKVMSNRLAGEMAVKIYVRKKHLDDEIPDEQRLPTSINGIPVDVEEVGFVRATAPACSLDRRRRQQPAAAGISVGHSKATAGTIGVLVRDRGTDDNGRRYILSNNHVLANCNDALAGDAIFQPGPMDAGTPEEHRIGSLARFARIRFGGADNTVDAAIAEVSPDAVLQEICALGQVAGQVTPRRNMTVFKHGRTTGLTRGVITDVDADIRVVYPGFGMALFINTVFIRGLPPTTPFSAGGDSGALIVDERQRGCALLFAGSNKEDVTFANPLGVVLRRLRVRLL